MDADALSGNLPSEISLGSPCVRLRVCRTGERLCDRSHQRSFAACVQWVLGTPLGKRAGQGIRHVLGIDWIGHVCFR